MKTLNKFLKVFQSIGKLNLKNKLVRPMKVKQLSKESDLLLCQINTNENEFLFI